jgi:L-iditol 2-dehydrogenase
MPSSTITTGLKPNVGVYTNPSHDLWLETAEPTAQSVEKGVSLQPGEVTVGIKSSGICG